MSPKEVMPFSSDFQHAHVAAQFAGFPFGFAGTQPHIRGLGSENRGEPFMLLSASHALPSVPALATHLVPRIFVIT